MENKLTAHAIPQPEIVTVLSGEHYSRACGAEARHQAIAPHDGVAINGVLYSVNDYMAPIRELEALRLPVEDETND